jgi:chromosome segregation ATPase
MSDNLNNNQLDFYHNQINQNQNNQANIFLRHDRREVSFVIDKNFLESSFNKFLTEHFSKMQQIEQNNQNIGQLYNIFQVMAQEIIKLKNDLTQAFNVESNKIGEIGEIGENNNQQINKMCEVFNNENSKNIESIKQVNNALNVSNQKISEELANQSKKLEESILRNKLENENINNSFKILNSNLQLAQNKNDGNEKVISNISDLCNTNNKKISELEAKLINFENNYKNNKEITEVKTNLNDLKIKIEDISNNISNFDNKFKKNKKEIENKIKNMTDKIDESNDTTFKKCDEITKEINKMKNDILNKRFESIKVKDDNILNELKEHINEFIENNNKEVEEIKNKHKKDIDIINNKIKDDLDKLNNECDNKIDININKLKTNFEKIEIDFKKQNEINSNHEKSI